MGTFKSHDHAPQSQRYLMQESITADIIMAEAAQGHIAKKLREIITKNVEFCDIYSQTAFRKDKKTRSKVKLLSGCECYVKPYEEFEFEIKGPQKKPNIKRRRIDLGQDDPLDTELQRLRSSTVSSKDIIAGLDLRNWAKKPDRNDKVFQYRKAGDGTNVLHAKELINEFTQLRRRNKWNESKIKQTQGS